MDSNLGINNTALVTPYFIPRPSKKRRNLGDGFIKAAIERRIGEFKNDLTFSTREEPSKSEVRRLISAGTVIIGGANMLSDDFTPWPNFDLDLLSDDRLRFFPFGIGINGIPKRNRGFTRKASEIIKGIHRNIEYSSWRCPNTVSILEASFPELKGRFVMTGCPVIYDSPIFQKQKFHEGIKKVAVTITERDDFFEREYLTLIDVKRNFPNADKFLVLHQDFRPKSFVQSALMKSKDKVYLRRIEVLHQLARDMGYSIIAPKTELECRQFYEGIDIHVGSRLHAHLNFLSRNKRSFLTYVDDRCLGFSEFYRFPLITPGSLEEHLDFDFEIVRGKVFESWRNMRKFLKQLPGVA